jgi:tetratricopeptide (TPR) repeat protein
MRWTLGVLMIAVGLAGCAVPTDERFDAYNEDGLHLYQQGNYAAARESFQAALGLNATDAGVLYNLAECYDRLGDDKNAERYYRDCLQRDPNHPAGWHALVTLLVRNQRRPEAEKMVQGWLASQPRLASPYAEDGWLALQAGDLPRAHERLQQALEIDPHDVRALTELGRVYEVMQRPDRALVLYERVLERDPGQTEVVNRVNFLLTKGVQRPHPD